VQIYVVNITIASEHIFQHDAHQEIRSGTYACILVDIIHQEIERNATENQGDAHYKRRASDIKFVGEVA
jgi:hypothetical protein